MLSQRGITCVFCLTAVSTQQHYCICFHRGMNLINCSLKKIYCQIGAKALDSGAESSSSECMLRHPSAAGSGQQTFGKGHHRR